jgi:hypothetical protein
VAEEDRKAEIQLIFFFPLTKQLENCFPFIYIFSVDIWESESKALHILNLETRWKWLDSYYD